MIEFSYNTDIWGALPGYTPLPKQALVHKSQKRVRLVLGGNSSGKTTAVAADLAMHLQEGNRNKGKLPTLGWILRPSFSEVPEEDPLYRRLVFGDDQLPPFVAPAMFDRISGKNKNIIELRNGSKCVLKTYKQDWQVVAGHSPDFSVCDEEVPQKIYEELVARMLRKTDCWFIMGATLVSSLPWVTHLISLSKKEDSIVDVIRMDSHENEYLAGAEQDKIIELIPEHRRGVRLHGQTKQEGAKVYAAFGPENWRDEEELPVRGTDYCFIDPGVGNPLAVLWIRVVPRDDGKVDLWCHREFYERGHQAIGAASRLLRETGAGLNPVEYWMDGWGGCQPVQYSGPSRGPITVKTLWNKEGIPARLMPKIQKNWCGPRALETRKWINLENKDTGNVYLTRNMINLGQELDFYHVKGMADPRDDIEDKRAEDFVGPNHLICSLEWACQKAKHGSMPHIELRSAAINQMDKSERFAHHLWNEAFQLGADPIRGMAIDQNCIRVGPSN